MNKNLILKLGILCTGLAVVIFFSKLSSSTSFKNSLNSLFESSATQINWCAEHVVDVAWVSADISNNLKQLSISQLKNSYCKLTPEPIQGVDMSKLTWLPLAESSGATGIKTILLWNKDLGLFKANGLPFKSSALSLELQK